MKSQIQALDLDALAAQPPAVLHSLLNCHPLNLAELNISSLLLNPGQTVARAASHACDQLYLLLKGQVEISLSEPDISDPSGHTARQTQTMAEPGTAAYQPAGGGCQLQGIGSNNDEPAILLVIRLAGLGRRKSSIRKNAVQDALITVPSKAIAAHNPDPSDPNAEKVLMFDAATALIKRLYCFFLNFEPGETVPVHYHRCHGVLLILLDGQIKTEAGLVGPMTILYYRGGEPHGFECVGDRRMLAFAIEFYREPPLVDQVRAKLRTGPLGPGLRKVKAALGVK